LASQPTSPLSTPTLASSHLPARDQSARRAGSGAGHLPTSRFTVVGFCHCGVLAPPVDPGSNTETHQNHTKRPDHGQNRIPRTRFPAPPTRTDHRRSSCPGTRRARSQGSGRPTCSGCTVTRLVTRTRVIRRRVTRPPRTPGTGKSLVDRVVRAVAHFLNRVSQVRILPGASHPLDPHQRHRLSPQGR